GGLRPTLTGTAGALWRNNVGSEGNVVLCPTKENYPDSTMRSVVGVRALCRLSQRDGSAPLGDTHHAIYRCPIRPKGRSSSRGVPESGECRMKTVMGVGGADYANRALARSS